MFKTCSDQILAKLINQGVAAALFSSTRLNNFENKETFPLLKIAETYMGGQFGVEKNDFGHKSSIF